MRYVALFTWWVRELYCQFTYVNTLCGHMTCLVPPDAESTFNIDASGFLPPRNACKSVIIPLHLKQLYFIDYGAIATRQTCGREDVATIYWWPSWHSLWKLSYSAGDVMGLTPRSRVFSEADRRFAGQKTLNFQAAQSFNVIFTTAV